MHLVLILAQSADVSLHDDALSSALKWALYKDNSAIFQALLQHDKIDMNRSNVGHAILMQAIDKGKTAIALALAQDRRVDLNSLAGLKPRPSGR